MRQIALDKTAKFLKCLLLAVAIAYVVTYLITVFFRIRYPFALEWLEGSLVEGVRRILSGQKLYISPSLDFVPWCYTPLYFYVSAAVSGVIGIGFLPLRLVSLLSSLGSFTIIFLFVKRETGNTFSAVLASCLFAATFRISGGWFDLARVDSLFLFLLLAGLYLVRFHSSIKSDVLAGALITLSFLTKQTALAISLPIMLYYVCLDRRRAIVFIATMAGLVGISTFVLDRIHGGWYSYYVFGIPAGIPIRRNMLVEFWIMDILGPLSIACSLSILYFCTQLSNFRKRDHLFYFLMVGGTVGAAWISRLNEGGYDNVLFPAYAAISIVFGLAAWNVLGYIQTASADRQKYFETAAYLILILQFACLIYNPLLLMPTEEDRQAGQRLVDQMAQIDGDIFVPYHTYLPVLAGKRSYANAEATYIILSQDKGENRARLSNEIMQAIREKRFSAIILDAHESRRLWSRGLVTTEFNGYCQSPRPIFDDESVFWPVTGVRVRPQVLMYLCSEGQVPY